MTTYLMVLACGTAVSLLATKLAIRLAPVIGAVDLPGPRKIHSKPVPRIGGLAIVFAVVVSVSAAMMLDGNIAAEARADGWQIAGLAFAALFVGATGLVDDIRRLRARYKLAAQMIAATALCALGVRITTLGVEGLFLVKLGWLSWPLTVIWIVGITNSVNLIDGLDGLAAGISAVACAVMAAFALQAGQQTMAVAMLAMLGALAGFLFFNCYPAKVYLGDSGSLFLGFAMAAASVFASTKQASSVGLALPLLALGIPVADALFCMVRRVLEGRSVFAPDRQHIHHRLISMGLKHSHAVLVLCTITALTAALSMFMMVSADARAFLVFGCVLLLLALSLRATGVFSLRSVIEAFLYNARLSREAKRHKQAFEEGQLRLRDARSTSTRWRVIREMAERIGAVKLIVTREDGRGVKQIVLCHHGPQAPEMSRTVRLSIPVPEGTDDATLRAEMLIRIEGSLEILGKRLTLLGRLIDEAAKLERCSKGSLPGGDQLLTAPVALADERTEASEAA